MAKDGLSFEDMVRQESAKAGLDASPRAERPQSGRRPAPPPGRRRGRGGMWALVILALVLLAGVAALAVGFTNATRVSELDTIYPNVTVNGVAVGGMTLQEAAAALGDPAGRYDNAAVIVNFPTGDTLTVTARQVGLEEVDGTSFAKMAYEYGREGTLLKNYMAYRACEAEPVALTYQREANEPDMEALRALVEPVAAQVDQKLDVVQAEYGEDAVTLVKNAGTAQVDVEAVCAAVSAAFQQEDYTTPILAEAVEPEGETADTIDTQQLVDALYDAVFKEPQDAVYDETAGSVKEGVPGVHIDKEEAARLWNEAKSGDKVVIPYIFDEPAVKAEDVTGRLFQDVLSEKSTSLSGSTSARINNITLAAKAMNGVVLQPGEEFNYNMCLGERTAAKGYQSAGAYSGGEHVMNIGGGICQGSSTLYYCALYANLKITARYDHYFPVYYLPRGLDATVSWGWPDFKFVNSRSYPIKIEAYVSGGYLTVRLYGTDEDGSYVQITSDTWEDSLYYYAQTYRNVYDKNGNLISSAAEAYSRYHKEGTTSSEETTSATPPPAAPAPTQPPAPPAEQPPQQEQPNTPPEQVTPPETQPETPPETQPETPPETQPETQPEMPPETQPETQPEPQPETQPEPQPEAGGGDTVTE